MLDLPAYLARIGQRRSSSADLAALASLHAAHVAAIPFENLDVLLERPISLDLAALQAKLVAGRRGGYCFEQNTLFRAVLETVGFRVTALAARVRAGGGELRPRTHMLLLVELPEGPHVADVGFGGDGPLHPLPLVAGVETVAAGAAHRFRREADLWVLEGCTDGAWEDLYAFTLEPQYAVDFEMANHYTSTYPRSRFRHNLLAQRVGPGGRALLRNRELVLREDSKPTLVKVRDPDHLLELLDRHFGLRFEPGTRFPQPPFE